MINLVLSSKLFSEVKTAYRVNFTHENENLSQQMK